MIYLVSLIVLIIDQITKILILNEMVTPRTIEVLPCLNLILAYNTGVSFSMFSNNSPYILSAFALVVCAGLAWWMKSEQDKLTRIGLSLIIGGAISNVIDRFLYGAVIDFLDFYVGSYHWPTFNIADSAICIGAFLICLKSVFLKREKK